VAYATPRQSELTMSPMKPQQFELELPVATDTPDTKADTITIRWKKGSNFPTIRGKWKRLADGRIEAKYSRAELEICRKTFETLEEVRT
jgi:hypothetical protein